MMNENKSSNYVNALRQWLTLNAKDFKMEEKSRQELEELLWTLPDVVVSSIWQHAFLNNRAKDYTLEEIRRDFRAN